MTLSFESPRVSRDLILIMLRCLTLLSSLCRRVVLVSFADVGVLREPLDLCHRLAVELPGQAALLIVLKKGLFGVLSLKTQSSWVPFCGRIGDESENEV